MSDPVDPRLAYTVSPGPSPSPVPDPAPSSPGTSPSPEPSPSPGPKPQPAAPWGKGSDVEVDPSFLRGRADSCDVAVELIRMTRGTAKDANDGLRKAAPGWSFTQSIDEMENRWEDLVKEVTGRLETAVDNFRLSADSYEENESRIQSSFSRLYR